MRAATVRAEMGPVLRAAARGLRAEAVFPGVEVRGPVVKLSSEQVGAGGDVTVHAEADGRMRYLVVALGPDEYRAAVAAHGEGKLVEVVGDLSRDGRGWRLTSPRAFAAVALETADSE